MLVGRTHMSYTIVMLEIKLRNIYGRLSILFFSKESVFGLETTAFISTVLNIIYLI